MQYACRTEVATSFSNHLKIEAAYKPGFIPSVFGDVTGAMIVMSFTITLLHIPKN